MIVITLKHILDFVGDSTRPLKEGYLIVHSSHIIQCGLVIDNHNRSDFRIFALVLQNSALREKPHEVNITITRTSYEFEDANIVATCTCHAGSDKCKHIVGVLLFIEGKDSEDIPSISCTDVVQSWGGLSKKALDAYQPCRLKSLSCHVRVRKEKYKEVPPSPTQLPSDIQHDIVSKSKMVFPNSMLATSHEFQNFIPNTSVHCEANCLPDSYILDIISRDLNNNSYVLNLLSCTLEEQQYFYVNLQHDTSKLLHISKDTCQQNTSSWYKERMFRITGSTSYSLFTYQKKERTEQEWERKISNIVNCTFKGNADTRFGKKYESVAIEKFIADVGGKYYTCGLIINKEVPFLGYSPDGFRAYEVNNKESLDLIEVTCPARGQHQNTKEMLENLSYIENDAFGSLSLKRNHPYYGQVQMGLYITRSPLCHFIIYNKFDNAYVKIAVKPNEEFGNMYIKALSDIYFKYYLPYLFKYNYT